jgi:hypothetical protein
MAASDTSKVTCTVVYHVYLGGQRVSVLRSILSGASRSLMLTADLLVRALYELLYVLLRPLSLPLNFLPHLENMGAPDRQSLFFAIYLFYL